MARKIGRDLGWKSFSTASVSNISREADGYFQGILIHFPYIPI